MKNWIKLVSLFLAVCISSCILEDEPEEVREVVFNWALDLQLGSIRLDSLTRDTSIATYAYGDTIRGTVHYEATPWVYDTLYAFNQYDGRSVPVSLSESRSFSISHRELFALQEGRTLIRFHMLKNREYSPKNAELTKSPFSIKVMIKDVVF